MVVGDLLQAGTDPAVEPLRSLRGAGVGTGSAGRNLHGLVGDAAVRLDLVDEGVPLGRSPAADDVGAALVDDVPTIAGEEHRDELLLDGAVLDADRLTGLQVERSEGLALDPAVGELDADVRLGSGVPSRRQGGSRVGLDLVVDPRLHRRSVGNLLLGAVGELDRSITEVTTTGLTVVPFRVAIGMCLLGRALFVQMRDGIPLGHRGNVSLRGRGKGSSRSNETGGNPYGHESRVTSGSCELLHE